MELLRFDYRTITPRFIPVVRKLTGTLAKASVITAREAESEYLKMAPDLLNNQLARAAAPGFLAARL